MKQSIDPITDKILLVVAVGAAVVYLLFTGELPTPLFWALVIVATLLMVLFLGAALVGVRDGRRIEPARIKRAERNRRWRVQVVHQSGSDRLVVQVTNGEGAIPIGTVSVKGDDLDERLLEARAMAEDRAETLNATAAERGS